MKYLIFLLLISNLSAAQTNIKKQQGYFNAGFSIYNSKNIKGVPGIFAGFGLRTGNITSGVSADLYLFDKNKTNFSIITADFRAYFTGIEKNIAPYISTRLGGSILKKTTGIVSKGGVAFGVLGGLKVTPGKGNFSITVSTGYQLATFKITNVTQKNNGIILNIGASF